MAFYQQIAPYYHYIFPLQQSQVDFVKSSFSHLAHVKILEAGCGIGLLSIALACSHFNITAFDLDESMLQEAHTSMQKLSVPSDHLQLLQLNMLQIDNVFKAGSFDGILCFGNTLVHLESKEKVLSFLLQVKKVLKPIGKLLFQILNYDLLLDQQITSLPLIDNEEIRFERYYDYPINSSLLEFKTILTIKKDQQKIVHSIPLLPLRFCDILSLLHQAGFNNFQFYGSYARIPFAFESDSLVIEAF